MRTTSARARDPDVRTRHRVLLAHHDDTTSELFKDRLEQAGLTVVRARDGAAALEAYRRDPPDAMLLARHLPKADALELLRILRREEGGVEQPVVVVNELGEDPELERVFEMGADDYLARPFSPEQVVDSVQRLLDG